MAWLLALVDHTVVSHYADALAVIAVVKKAVADFEKTFAASYLHKAATLLVCHALIDWL